MKANPTLADVKAAMDKAFEPDIVFGVTDDGHIYSRSPRTALGWRFMRAVRGVDNIDKAREAGALLGLYPCIETH